MNLFVANWKMNMTRAEARTFSEELGRFVADKDLEVELVVAPPLTSLDAARDPKGRWSLAAQNVASEREGAFTGEVSALQLADAGCRYVIVGHSERRRIFGEGAAVLSRKLERVREARLVPIYCVGETQDERAKGHSFEVLTRQLETVRGDPADAPLVIAYEPVWAIGTGQIAMPADCAKACGHIRQVVGSRRDLRLLYGGSVTPDNAREMLGGSGVAGFLIGGASLKAASFASIAGLA
jgi:triosephosphate isomerase (TIM)